MRSMIVAAAAVVVGGWACSAPAPAGRGHESTPVVQTRPAAPTEPATEPVADDRLAELRAELTGVNPADVRSRDQAVKAADALADAQVPEAQAILIEAASAQGAFDARLSVVRLSTIVALGKYRGHDVVAALSAMLERSLDDYERAASAGDVEGQRDAAIQSGAAVNALGETRSPQATTPLIHALYRLPAIAMQCRRALVASGAGVAGEMKQILEGTHADVNQLFTDKKLGTACTTPTDCQPLGIRDFYAALILGDLHDPTAVKDLLAALDRPALPVWVVDGTPSPNTQHNAIYDALRKLGSADAAAKCKAVWSDPKQPVDERTLAVAAYGFVARDASAVKLLRKQATDRKTDLGLQLEMLTTIARLATSEKDMEVLRTLATQSHKQYLAAKKKSEGKEKAAYDAAKTALASAKQKTLAAVAVVNAAGNNASAGQNNAMLAAMSVNEAAKKKFDHARDAWKPLDDDRAAALAATRGLELDIARVEIVLHCSGGITCYAETLVAAKAAMGDKLAAAELIGKRLAPYITTWDEWSDDDKTQVIGAQIERAMIELGKLGPAAADHAPALLEAASSDDRLVRESILLALPEIAKVPCADCETRLDAAVKATEGSTTMADLNVETMILRNYFSWAGGRTTTASP